MIKEVVAAVGLSKGHYVWASSGEPLALDDGLLQVGYIRRESM